jgi:hypothetical protein
MNHAVALLIPFSLIGYPASGQPLYPATRAEIHCQETGKIVMGTRFAIPKSVNLSTLNLSAPALALAKAMQTYGAYVIDSAGSVNLNADGAAAQADGQALRNVQADLNKILAQLTVVNPPDGASTATLAKPPGCP